MPMQPQTLADPEKSTTVRPGELPMRPPAPVRWMATGLSRLAPGPSARIAAELFLRTRRPGRPPRESGWLRDAEPGTLRVDGRRIVTWTWGAAGGDEAPAVLLMHGWMGRGSQLGAFATALAARGVRTVALDAPGHGGSEGSSSSLPAMAEAMRAVANRIGPLAAVVAHSAGTAATTLALSRGLDAGRAVYLSPPGELVAFAHMFGEALGLTPAVQHRLKRAVERKIGLRWEQIHGREMARTMNTPLLVIHDYDDREVPLAGGRELVAAWPGARLVATRGLGHRRLLRDTGVIDTTLRFLALDADVAQAFERTAGRRTA